MSQFGSYGMGNFFGGDPDRAEMTDDEWSARQKRRLAGQEEQENLPEPPVQRFEAPRPMAPPPKPQPFRPFDKPAELHLSKLNASMAQVDKDVQEGTLAEAEGDMLRDQLQALIGPMQKRKEQTEAMAKQQQAQQTMQDTAMQIAMQIKNGAAIAQGFPQTIAQAVDGLTGTVARFFQPRPGEWEQVQEPQAEEGGGGGGVNVFGSQAPMGGTTQGEPGYFDPPDQTPEGMESGNKGQGQMAPAEGSQFPNDKWPRTPERAKEMGFKVTKNPVTGEPEYIVRNPDGTSSIRQFGWGPLESEPAPLPGDEPAPSPDYTVDAAAQPLVGGQRMNRLTGQPAGTRGNVMSLPISPGTAAHQRQVQQAAQFQQLRQSGVPYKQAEMQVYRPQQYQQQQQLAHQLAQAGMGTEVAVSAADGLITSADVRQAQALAAQAHPYPQPTGNPRIDIPNRLRTDQARSDTLQTMLKTTTQNRMAKDQRAFKGTEADKVRDHRELMQKRAEKTALLVKDHAFENAKALDDYITANNLSEEDRRDLHRQQAVSERKRKEESDTKQAERAAKEYHQDRSAALSEIKARGVPADKIDDKMIDEAITKIRTARETHAKNVAAQVKKDEAEKEAKAKGYTNPAMGANEGPQPVAGIAPPEGTIVAVDSKTGNSTMTPGKASELPSVPQGGFQSANDLAGHLEQIRKAGKTFDDLPDEHKKAILDARSRLGK